MLRNPYEFLCVKDKKLPPIQPVDYSAIMFGKKMNSSKKREMKKRKKRFLKKFLAIGVSESNPSLTYLLRS